MVEDAGAEARARRPWARSWAFIVPWTALYVVSAKLLFGLPGMAFPLVWVLIFVVVATLVMPRDVVLIQFLAFFVFFEQTLWYIWPPEMETIYEREIFYAKPVEILVLMTATRVLLSRGTTLVFPRAIFMLSAAWVITILLGIAVAVLQGNSLYDVFVFSEFRTLLLALAMVFCLLALIVENPTFAFNMLIVFAAAKALVTLASLALGSDILWPASAHNYAGELTAFYGSDFNVRIVLLALTFAAMYLLASRPGPAGAGVSLASGSFPSEGARMLPRWGYVAISILLGVAVVLSLRRGGILGMAVIGGLIWWLSSARARLLAIGVIVVLALAVFADAASGWLVLPLPVQSLYDRFLGHDPTAAFSNWGHWQDILEGWRVVQASPVFGLGPGSRFELSRMAYYNLDASLLVHQSLLHVWIKYGLLGLAIYILTFLAPVVTGLSHWRRVAEAASPIAGATMLAGAFYLISQFVTELYTPPFFQNFRASMCVVLAISAIYAPMLRVRLATGNGVRQWAAGEAALRGA